MLLTVHCTLYASRCALYTAYYALHTAHCALHTAHWTLHTEHYKLHSVHFFLNSAHFSLQLSHQTAQCTAHWTKKKNVIIVSYLIWKLFFLYIIGKQIIIVQSQRLSFDGKKDDSINLPLPNIWIFLTHKQFRLGRWNFDGNVFYWGHHSVTILSKFQRLCTNRSGLRSFWQRQISWLIP